MAGKKLYIACGAAALVLVAALVLALALGSGGKGKYEKLYSEAQSAYLAGDLDTALKKLGKAVDAKPEEEAYMLMADIYEREGDTQMAIQALYLGYSRTGSDEIASRLDTLKSGKQTDAAAGTVSIAGEEVRLDADALVMASRELKSSDISSLSQVTGLTTLSLSDNYITDITPVSVLTELEFLQLNGNLIADISPLKGLTRLKTLYLDDNPITDFTPLYALTSLKTLSMKGVEIGQSQLDELCQALPNCAIYTDKAVEEVVEVELGGMTFMSDVESLDLSGRGITDISELAVCKQLKKLNLSQNSITDISPLVDMQLLQWLDISENSISELGPLLSLTELSYLDVHQNGVTDISVAGYLRKLMSLNASGNELSVGLGAVAELPELEKLFLKNTGLTDEALTQLETAQSLRELNIEENSGLTKKGVDALAESLSKCSITAGELYYTVQLGMHEYRSDEVSITELSADVSSLDGLENFTELKTLVLTNNSVSELSQLRELEKLETLDLYANKVSDLSPLRSHTALKKLDLYANNISDLAPLSGCTGLEELTLGCNDLKKLTGLSSLSKLKRLSLEDNRINDLTPLSGLTSLEYLNLNDNELSDLTPLYSLRSLKYIYIQGNALTHDAIEELRAALPDCTVVSDTDVAAMQNRTP